MATPCLRHPPACQKTATGTSSGYLPAIRRALPWLALTGLAGNFTFVWINRIVGSNPMEASAATVVMWLAASAGIPLLSLFYIGLVMLLHASGRGARWLRPFACVGRMALTNYLLQSAICTTIFYGFGLGRYGRTPPLPGLLLAVAIYGLQVILSALWLRHYRYGPIEWLWRTLTYGRL